MNWINIIGKATKFIEIELFNVELSPDLVAENVNISVGHFSRTFNILTNYSVAEYIRNRRLFEAGRLLQTTTKSVLEVALYIGYESPEAFAKAYKRFHGFNPRESKGRNLKEFWPMEVTVTITQDRPLNCAIEKKGPIILNGNTKEVSSYYENDMEKLWQWCEDSGYLKTCYSFTKFKKLAGIYSSNGYTIKAICEEAQKGSLILPPIKWAIFKCEGKMPEGIDYTWNKIYSTWINKDGNKMAELPQLEVYEDHEDGYSCEIWIPIL